jgi:membrane protein implicated in regulation of membrane protease activity
MAELLSPELAWFLVGLVCIIAEFAAPGVVIIFFGAGAWAVALLVHFVEISLFLQLILFTGVSVGLLLLLRRRLNPQTPDVPEGAEDFIGRTAVVAEPIVRNKPGRVKFKGSTWMARTTSEVPLGVDQRVRIVHKESLVLEVSPIPLGRSRRDLSAGPRDPSGDDPAASSKPLGE